MSSSSMQHENERDYVDPPPARLLDMEELASVRAGPFTELTLLSSLLPHYFFTSYIILVSKVIDHKSQIGPFT